MREPDRADSQNYVWFGSVGVNKKALHPIYCSVFASSISLENAKKIVAIGPDLAAAIEWHERRQAYSEEGR